MRRVWLLIPGLISFLPCFGADLSPDTIQLVSDLKRFRDPQMNDPAAAEYKPVQREYMTWLAARLKGGSRTAQINEELESAGLLSEGPQTVDDFFESWAGYVDKVEDVPVSGAGDVSAIKAGIYTGGYCNQDDTVVLYTAKPFRIVAQINAQSSYTHGYRLRTLTAGGADPRRGRIIGSAWVASNCTSNWNGNILRIDVQRESTMRNGLERSTAAFGDAPMNIVVQANSVSFDYTTLLDDTEGTFRRGIERYQIQAGRAIRQSPIADSLAGFIDEWLKMDDAEAARWATPEASARHHELAGRFRRELFDWQRLAECPGSSPAREVTIQSAKSRQTTAFRIGGTDAATLRILAVSGEPSSACREINGSDLPELLAAPLPGPEIR